MKITLFNLVIIIGIIILLFGDVNTNKERFNIFSNYIIDKKKKVKIFIKKFIN